MPLVSTRENLFLSAIFFRTVSYYKYFISDGQLTAGAGAG
jgi:hypothetical protein